MSAEAHDRVSSAVSGRNKFWSLKRALLNDSQVVTDRFVVRLAGTEIEQLVRLMPLLRWVFNQQEDWERVTKLVTHPSPVDLLGGLAEVE